MVPRWAASGWMPSAKASQRSPLRRIDSDGHQGRLCQICTKGRVLRRPVAGPPEGPGVLGADRAGPHHVEAAQRALVQLHHVAQRGLELRLQVHADDLPALSREGPANRARPGEQLQEPHLSLGRTGARQGRRGRRRGRPAPQVADDALAPGHGRRRGFRVVVERVHCSFLGGG